VEAVHRYQILDTPQDGAFDRITALAARLFSVPIAIVSVVDHDRIWFKSHHGVDVDHVDREPGLCASAILQNEPWIIQDARTDSRALSNPRWPASSACSSTRVFRCAPATGTTWARCASLTANRAL